MKIFQFFFKSQHFFGYQCYAFLVLLYYATLRYSKLRYSTLLYATLPYSTLLYATLGGDRKPDSTKAKSQKSKYVS
jgi:drug/metabolite transporter (DMT)-like permease